MKLVSGWHATTIWGGEPGAPEGGEPEGSVSELLWTNLFLRLAVGGGELVRWSRLALRPRNAGSEAGDHGERTKRDG
jgi:hypothetical protein